MSTNESASSRFADRVGIVTGGTCGIGLAIAQALLEEGAKVVVSTLPADEAEGSAELESFGDRVLIVPGDLEKESYCEELVSRATNDFGRIDLLVNNAFSFVAKWMDATREDWHRSLHVGPMAYAKLASLCAEPMQQVGRGAIVNVTSISGVVAQPKRWTYNAAKGAVNQLTRCMALDFAPMNIRVNSVSPGWIWTRENDKAAGYDRDKFDPIWGDFCMMRRMGKTEEVAKAVLFLLSDDASFITAADLPVDGGYQGLGPEGLGQNTIVAGSQ